MMTNFECQRCGYCCSNHAAPSIVFPEDRERWKDRPDILEYFEQCVNEIPCKFFKAKDNECLIYDIRPVSCRTSHFSEHKSYCPGVKDE
jgi:Fe-S-cluster containining protein